MSNPPEKPVSRHQEEKIDEVRLFMLYTLFGGDAKRTAVVSRIDEARIASLAHDFRWKDKLSGRGSLETEKGLEGEKVLNRITNYVTAERLKRVFGRLVDELDSDPTFARAFCSQPPNGDGEPTFQVKNLVELAKGLQVCNDLTYRALGDKQAAAADAATSVIDSAALTLATYKALAKRFDSNIAIDTAKESLLATDDPQT